MASLEQLVEEEKQRIRAKFNPVAQTTRYSLLEVLASLAAADRFLVQENAAVLEQQIFPDTASGDALREHWRARVAPLEPLAATGQVMFSGQDGVTVPAGSLWQGAQTYYLVEAVLIDQGRGRGTLVAQEAGSLGNLSAGTTLMLASTAIVGLDPECTTEEIGGGVDSESDDVYRARVIAYERSGVRIGRSGDLSAWAVDSSAEVTTAWEFPNFDSSGATLVLVMSGSHLNTVGSVSNLDIVINYLTRVAPLQLLDVRSVQIIFVDLRIDLLPIEDTQKNREQILAKLRLFWQIWAKPSAKYTNEQIRSAIVDGFAVTEATVQMEDANPFIVDQYSVPTQGAVVWGVLDA